MIRIKIFRQTSGLIIACELHGHSQTAESGRDIVCAAVSALAQTALLGLCEHLHRRVDFQMASGDLRLHLQDEPDSMTETVLGTMLLGLQAIAKLHPQAVHITEKQGVKYDV